MPRPPLISCLIRPCLAAALTALTTAGCTTAPRPAPLPPPPTVALAPGQYTAAFDATVETLRRAGFRIDRADHRFGVVTTRPEGSPTVFEPWKTGNTSAHTRTLSTLNDVRRTITVTFSPAAGPAADPLRPTPLPRERDAARNMQIAVHLETRDTPGRRLNGSADRRVFNDPAPPRRANRDDPPAPTIFWHVIGRDPGLEAQLRQRIADRLDAALAAVDSGPAAP